MNGMGLRVVLFCLACLLTGTTNAQVSEAEREALIDLYHATGGDDWHDNEGWLGEAGSECEWHGVHCLGEADNDAYVSILRLPGNRLGGLLPETLVDLERVRMIDLRANQIGGPVPPSLGDLPELHSLDLGGNNLTGPVPGELLASPAYTIKLDDNQLDGYTEPAGSSQDSITLDLSGNPISSLPPASWRDAGALVVLYLNRAALNGEIDFGHHPWPGLRQLFLDDNTISGLQGISPGTLTDLRRLSLADNEIATSWPLDELELPELRVLDLTGNGLFSPPIDLSGHPALAELYLSDNQLHGLDLAPLFAIPTLRILELHNNPLQTLPPELTGGVAPLLELDLSGSELAGTPPEWFADLPLRHLDLAGNLLDGEVEPWLAALQEEDRITLDLSRNLFEGPLPESLLEIDFSHANLSSGPGLNLCWNRFDEPFGSEFDAFLEQFHVAHKLSDCNDRALAEIDPTISGSWYDPARSGKGYTAMLLDSGQLLYYWFGYPSHRDQEIQKWSFQMIEPGGTSARFPQALAPFGGQFGQGLGRGTMADIDRREVEMVPRAGGKVVITTSTRPAIRGMSGGPIHTVIQERFDHQRLTELAGTHCDNQNSYQDYSGAWFNPDLNGEGFILEVLPDDHGLVYWFTYAPDGSGRQAWMIGVGQFDTGGITIGTPPPGSPEAWLEIERMDQPVGTELGPNFDSEAVDRIDWGSLVLAFYEDGTAQVAWDSHLEEYGSGDYELKRLARPMLAECD